MPKTSKTWKPVQAALWLTFALVSSGCAARGKLVCPSPVRLPKLPSEMMVPPTTESQVRAEFFGSPESVTPP